MKEKIKLGDETYIMFEEVKKRLKYESDDEVILYLIAYHFIK